MDVRLAAIPFALVGWGLGWLSAWAIDALHGEDKVLIPGRSAWVRDPLVQGGSALVWAAAPVWLQGPWWRWVEVGLIGVPLIQVAVTDLRTRYVYTLAAGAGLALGMAVGWHVHGVDWWWGPIGAAGGGLAFGLVYGLGRLVYRGGEPIASGDMTIAAMVGGGAAACAAQALVLGILLSGLLALGMWVVRRSRSGFMPYGPGLCLGGLATLFLC